MSKIPLELLNLSKDLNKTSVPYSGWPPSNRVELIQVPVVPPLIIDQIDHDEKPSIAINDKSYFEKLLASAEHRRTNKIKSHLTTTDDTFEHLIASIQPCNTKNLKSQTELLLSRLQSLKQIHIESIQKIQQYFPLITSDGNIFFDFTKQFIRYDIYIELMQLVRLSNLDKFIQKIFHKSGEYHHVDYKENRRNQIKKDQENCDNSSDQYTHQDLAMAKAVHFRRSSHCFVVDGIDISSRFQYDRNILRDTCLRFHNYDNMDKNTDSEETTQVILVLCTEKMKKIYGLLESLLKSYISSTTNLVYLTFDQIEAFLIKYEQIFDETPQKDTPTSFDFHTSPTISTQKTTMNQNIVLFQEEMNDENIPIPASEKDSLHRSSETDDTTAQIDASNEEVLLDYFRASSLILIFMKHLDEPYLTAFIRWYTESCLSSDLQSSQPLASTWNKDVEHFWLFTSDYQHAQTVFNIPKPNLFLWPTEHNAIDHISIIISSILILPIAISINYQNYTKLLDGMSIVDRHCQETTLDRNICIQMALVRIWLMICERKTIGIITCDDDLQHFGEYVQMLLSEYDHVNERKMIARYTSIHGIPLVQTFLQQILNEQNHFSYDLIAIHEPNIHPEQSSSSLITTNPPIEIEKTSHPHTSILLDQLTPLTLGVLIGVYELSIFFERYLSI